MQEHTPYRHTQARRTRAHGSATWGSYSCTLGTGLCHKQRTAPTCGTAPAGGIAGCCCRRGRTSARGGGLVAQEHIAWALTGLARAGAPAQTAGLSRLHRDSMQGPRGRDGASEGGGGHSAGGGRAPQHSTGRCASAGVQQVLAGAAVVQEVTASPGSRTPRNKLDMLEMSSSMRAALAHKLSTTLPTDAHPVQCMYCPILGT